MAQQNLTIGTEGAGQGESLFSAFTKIEAMMTELYLDDAGDVGSITATAPLERDQSTGSVTISLADNGITATQLNVGGNGSAGQALISDGDGSFSWTNLEVGDITQVTAGTGLTGGGASGDVTLAVSGLTTTELAANTLVIESEGIGSNDNDTTIPTSAAVKDYVDSATDNDTLAGLNNGDGNFVVGNGSAFVVESGSTARDSIGLGTSGHIQFHCLGVGQAASTLNGQIDATTVYAGTFGLNSGDKIGFTDNTQIDFTVNGNNEMRLEADGDLHVDGDVIAASTTVASDEKLKENIKPIFGAGEILNKIKGVDFTWKKDGQKSSGVIAQDIEKVMPHLVKEVKSLDTEDSHLTVDYNGLIGVLIEAVKDLKSEVETLKNK